MKRGWIPIMGVCLVLSFSACKQLLPYQDTSLTAEQRAEDLLPRLTLEEKVSLIVFDVNDFKLINDTYGHSEGDRILTEVAKILKEYYQEYGRVYRIGGDEFAAIIEKSTDKSEIEKIATRFKEKVEERNGQLKNEKKLEIPRISYGISVYNPKNNLEHSFEDVINEADEEMYNYKKIYKNQNKQQ